MRKQIGQWTATTKPCRDCGYHNENLTLKDRQWTCADCGSHHDRDKRCDKPIAGRGRYLTICLVSTNEQDTGEMPVGGATVRRLQKVFTAVAMKPKPHAFACGCYHNIPHPHPRSYGCFVQYLGKFIRERQLVSMKEAIYKMSGFPAERFRLKERGRIATGLAADIVIFNAETVADSSTWFDPVQTPVGVEWVFVNGTPVIENSRSTGKLPGRVLRKTG